MLAGHIHWNWKVCSYFESTATANQRAPTRSCHVLLCCQAGQVAVSVITVKSHHYSSLLSPRWLEWKQAFGGGGGGRGGQDGLSQFGRTHTGRSGHRGVLRVQGKCVSVRADTALTMPLPEQVYVSDSSIRCILSPAGSLKLNVQCHSFILQWMHVEQRLLW